MEIRPPCANREEIQMITRVLVVENNEDLTESLARHLRSCRFQVLAAQTGTEAVGLAISEHPDVILVKRGRANRADSHALAQIRANVATRGIPILTLASEYLQPWRTPRLNSE
jgi:DNA-binding response OmpR family regulator